MTGSDKATVTAIFLIGCLSSSIYLDFCFPLLLPALSQHAAKVLGIGTTPRGTADISWAMVFPASRDVLWFVIFCVAGTMALWTFLQAVTVDPGHVPLAFHRSTSKSASLALRIVGDLHPCAGCMVFKPPRAHHCSRCGRCVLKYDHHCPWIGQCVGFFNYKLYLLFVWYTQLFTQVVTMTIGGSVLRAALHSSGVSVEDDGSHVSTMTQVLRALSRLPIGSTASAVYDASFGIVFAYVTATVFQLLTLYLIAKHTRLSRHNLTTVDEVIVAGMPEDERMRWVNPYDLGVDYNLSMVFGDGPWSPAARHHESDSSHPQTRTPFMRWLHRLLPLSAYPAQSPYVVKNPRAFSGCVVPSSASALAATPHPDYGSSTSPTAPDDASLSSDALHLIGPKAALLKDDRYLGIVMPINQTVIDNMHQSV